MKFMDPALRTEVTARLRAWWDGRDYVPGEPDPAHEAEELRDASKPSTASELPQAGAAAIKSAAPASAKASKRRQALAPTGADGVGARSRALETIWGAGRFGPWSEPLVSLLLDATFLTPDSVGDIAFLGADPVLLAACRARSDRNILASDWREDVIERVKALSPDVAASLGEPDRPRGLPDGASGAVCSVDAFAFSDHKAGLVSRVFRTLSPTGRWVILDTTRATRKAPFEAFASAWAEPQLATIEEIDELLSLAGFTIVSREPAKGLILDAARDAYQRLGAALETSVRAGLADRQGPMFLQELAWEAASWRARIRALEGGALDVNLWVADKVGGGVASQSRPASRAPAKSKTRPSRAAGAPDPEPEADMSAWGREEKETGQPAETAEPLDQGAIDSLFD